MRKVLHMLAQGEMTHQAIAREVGVSRGRISQINGQYKAEIEEIKANMEDEFAGLWIAKKEARLAEYEGDVDRINANYLLDGELDAADIAALLRVKQAALRAAADELGQIPQRMQLNVGGKVVTYRIEGVDPEDLK